MITGKNTRRGVLALAAALLVGAATAPASASRIGKLDAVDLGTIGDIFRGGVPDILRRGGGGTSLAESILERELPRRVGPADRYDVRIDSRNADLSRGRLGRVDVTGIGVRTRDGLTIPRMALELSDVRLGLGSRSLQSVGRSSFLASLGEDVVSAYVRKRAGAGVRDVRVAFRDGAIQVRATPELLGFALPSEVVGKPVLDGRDAVNFEASRVAVAGLRLPGFGVDMLEDKVNPIVDLSRLNLPVRIRDLRVDGDRLVAEGAADFGAR